MNGKITKEHTVWCVKCANWYQVSSYNQTIAIKYFKSSGWRKSKGSWMCPDCQRNDEGVN